MFDPILFIISELFAFPPTVCMSPLFEHSWWYLSAVFSPHSQSHLETWAGLSQVFVHSFCSHCWSCCWSCLICVPVLCPPLSACCEKLFRSFVWPKGTLSPLHWHAWALYKSGALTLSQVYTLQGFPSHCLECAVVCWFTASSTGQDIWPSNKNLPLSASAFCCYLCFFQSK